MALVESICARFGVPMDAAALAFSTHSELVDATAVGVSSLARLKRLYELVATDLPSALLDELEAVPERATGGD